MMYKLEKLTDDVFEGEHPNGVLAGMSWVGHINFNCLIFFD